MIDVLLVAWVLLTNYAVGTFGPPPLGWELLTPP